MKDYGVSVELTQRPFQDYKSLVVYSSFYYS